MLKLCSIRKSVFNSNVFVSIVYPPHGPLFWHIILQKDQIATKRESLILQSTYFSTFLCVSLTIYRYVSKLFTIKCQKIIFKFDPTT